MLLVLLAASWALTSSAAEHRELLHEILFAATYTTNMSPLLVGYPVVNGVPYDGLLGHMWSLAVEEQFYLVWPVMMLGLGLPARNSRRLVGTIVAVAAAIALLRFAVYYLPSLDPDLASISVFSFDAFAIGAALAFAFHRGTLPRLEAWLGRPAVPFVAVGVLVADLLVGRYSHEILSLYVVYSTLAAAALIGHLFVATDSIASKLASFPAVVLIGKLSYSIYLWHNPIWTYVSQRRFPGTPVAVLTIAEWSLTVVAVLFSFYVIERPAMRLRSRFAH
jgi:peptidoglycan/LPS O-acetylase OafA/YrhL